ncbi:MAG: protein-glutamate O-methyltransferase CheR [Deltaproteobacteria bacterium]|nr:protein-glutamate O-methyltransferase CheR [Deltaproteobacteria bacterium]NND29117.1 protein-glutamate O-methyltransferase CheR [Myxococcales bacterium]MBT8463472.1 protein-glutamate O-methyltransferase CheR [Deltaproteobacteria bacterium]MBT8480968.1 protein-glutamate O-methyltransferase CheR [Deltaproteobacteria bacterium]NNK08568.1 protein-glutamate O-methyltransferase CheR [Myxococcales bacterium]
MELSDFRLLRDFINRFCGIYFADDSAYIVERRLRERLRDLRVGDFAEYYRYLQYHPKAEKELEAAAEVLTTNETYFFREAYQLRAFTDEILPAVRSQALARGSKRLDVWSAGCSSGEEVFTIAMLIDSSGLFDGWNVRVFGNDISRRVLNKARAASYSSASFRAMIPEYAKYFIESEEGRQVHPRIRAMCHFGHLNLMNERRAAIVGRVDVTFCRNVLIYFDDASRRKVLDTIYQRLNRGGYLLLGHSESLLRASTAFEITQLTTDIVYRRPIPFTDIPPRLA